VRAQYGIECPLSRHLFHDCDSQRLGTWQSYNYYPQSDGGLEAAPSFRANRQRRLISVTKRRPQRWRGHYPPGGFKLETALRVPSGWMTVRKTSSIP
jgi:hypothetical protein